MGRATNNLDPEDLIDHGADEVAESAKGDPRGTARGRAVAGKPMAVPPGSTTAALKKGSGGSTKRRSVSKRAAGSGS